MTWDPDAARMLLHSQLGQVAPTADHLANAMAAVPTIDPASWSGPAAAAYEALQDELGRAVRRAAVTVELARDTITTEAAR